MNSSSPPSNFLSFLLTHPNYGIIQVFERVQQDALQIRYHAIIHSPPQKHTNNLLHLLHCWILESSPVSLMKTIEFSSASDIKIAHQTTSWVPPVHNRMNIVKQIKSLASVNWVSGRIFLSIFKKYGVHGNTQLYFRPFASVFWSFSQASLFWL